MDNLTKKEIIKEHGKERVLFVGKFLSKINRLYGFSDSEANLFDFVVSLRKFDDGDLDRGLEFLEDRASTFPLKFNEIKIACKEAKREREVREDLTKEEEDNAKACPMPAHIKKRISEILR